MTKRKTTPTETPEPTTSKAVKTTVNAPKQSRPLVFLHIPKTGGHTLRAVLNAVYGKAVCPAQNWDELTKVDVSKYSVFIGHFGYAAARSLFGDDADYATFLREPNERLLSLYHYLKATNQIDPAATLDTYLRKLAPQRGDVNQMLNYLAETRETNWAVANLHGFTFVGWFESFDAEIELLAHVLGWSGVPVVPQLNTLDGERLSLDDLTDEQRELLRYTNELDIDIYAHAVEQIWSKVV